MRVAARDQRTRTRRGHRVEEGDPVAPRDPRRQVERHVGALDLVVQHHERRARRDLADRPRCGAGVFADLPGVAADDRGVDEHDATVAVRADVVALDALDRSQAPCRERGPGVGEEVMVAAVVVAEHHRQREARVQQQVSRQVVLPRLVAVPQIALHDDQVGAPVADLAHRGLQAPDGVRVVELELRREAGQATETPLADVEVGDRGDAREQGSLRTAQRRHLAGVSPVERELIGGAGSEVPERHRPDRLPWAGAVDGGGRGRLGVDGAHFVAEAHLVAAAPRQAPHELHR